MKHNQKTNCLLFIIISALSIPLGLSESTDSLLDDAPPSGIPIDESIPSTSVSNPSEILDDYFDLLESTKVSSDNASLIASEEIEIGKNVQWTQTVLLDHSSGNVAIEIPDDAKNITVTSDEQTLQNNMNVISKDQIDLGDDDSIGSSIMINDEVASLFSLDQVASIEEDQETKFVVVSEESSKITIQYETPAPYVLEKETINDDSYEKTLTIKSDSTLHYQNVRSYGEIPEMYTLQGIPFKLDWILDGKI